MSGVPTGDYRTGNGCPYQGRRMIGSNPSATRSELAMTTISFDHTAHDARPAVTDAERPARNLRRVLAANATTSGAAGIAGLVAASWWSDTLGIPSVGWIQLVSVGLVVFAIDVALVAARAKKALPSAALAISMADLAWVIGTGVVLATMDLTTTGWILAVVMGVGVADFALLQLWFRSRLG
jgi:hypothetical protein